MIKPNPIISFVYLWIGVFLIFGTEQAWARQEVVQVEIVSNAEQIQPGQEFLIGVHFTIEPGWHIYWKEPGDAGLATSIEFSSSIPVEFSNLYWPPHKNFRQPGNVTGYGYSSEVVIYSKAQLNPKAVIDSQLSIKGKIDWLACKEICVLGSKELDFNIPIKNKAVVKNEELFTRFKGQI